MVLWYGILLLEQEDTVSNITLSRSLPCRLYRHERISRKYSSGFAWTLPFLGILHTVCQPNGIDVDGASYIVKHHTEAMEGRDRHNFSLQCHDYTLLDHSSGVG